MFNQIPYMMVNPAYSAMPAINVASAPAAKIAGKTTGILGKINWSSLLSNAQKTLNVVNQAIPLYYQVKPVFNNIKTLGKIGKEFFQTDNSKKIDKIPEEMKNNDIYNDNQELPNPTFFL